MAHINTDRPRKIDTKTLLQFSPLFMAPTLTSLRSELSMAESASAALSHSFNSNLPSSQLPTVDHLRPSPVTRSPTCTIMHGMTSTPTASAAPLPAPTPLYPSMQTPMSSLPHPAQLMSHHPSPLASFSMPPSSSYLALSALTSTPQSTEMSTLPRTQGYSPSMATPTTQTLSLPAQFPTPTAQIQTPENPSCLDRLQSNPIFQDLQKLLSQECRHLQVPASLITTSWNSNQLLTPSTVDTNQRVASLHAALQDEFLHLHTDTALRNDSQQLEHYYCTEVGRIEMERYQALHAALCSEHQKYSINIHFDNERISLCQHLDKEIQHLKLTRNPSVPTHQDHLSPVSDISSPLTPPSVLDSPTESVSSAQKSFSIVDFLSPSLSIDASAKSPDFSGSVTESFTQNLSADSGIHSQESSPETSHHTVSSPVEPVTSPTESVNSSVETTVMDNTLENHTGRLLKSETTRILTEWYDAHIKYPYPSDEDVKYLSNKGGIKPAQVRKWLANKRVRSFNTLSITGNDHPIKYKYQGRTKKTDASAPSNRRSQYKLLTPAAKKILTDWYESHQENPYPTEEQKEELADLAQISSAQVKSWFANKRSRNNNTRKQIPNYFIKKYPNYTPIVEMVGQMRAAKKQTKFDNVRVSLFQ
ncbi:mucin-2-like [Haliotis asinina]|uniref:mucin-2-like n=1 Tax=Haliotis asinina TaxID=109174 RepID=UPI003531DF90